MSRLALRCGNGGRCSRSLRRQGRRAASIWLRSCRVVVRQSNYSLTTVYKTQSRPSHPRPTIPCPIYIFALIARISHPNPRNHSEVNFPAPPSLSPLPRHPFSQIYSRCHREHPEGPSSRSAFRSLFQSSSQQLGVTSEHATGHDATKSAIAAAESTP